jgi:PHD/YefM family antitoxin component YafN of YafNO toxin-antitoxin module
MTRTTAMEFQRQHKAQREPVEITRHGRRKLVLMSAEHYDWLTAAARRTYRTQDATSIVSRRWSAPKWNRNWPISMN